MRVEEEALRIRFKMAFARLKPTGISEEAAFAIYKAGARDTMEYINSMVNAEFVECADTEEVIGDRLEDIYEALRDSQWGTF